MTLECCMALCAWARLANGWAKLPSLESLPVVDTKNPDDGVPTPPAADPLPLELPDPEDVPVPVTRWLASQLRVPGP